jgi:NAD(P)H-flavin reductase
MESLMLPEVMRVARFRRETHDTYSLLLDASERGGLPFRPGQFNMLYAFGVGEAPISISGDPRKPHQLWHTIRDVGPVTHALGRLRKGHELGLRGPYGSGWPLERAIGWDVVFVAGGIGLAPLRPAIYAVIAQRKQFGRVAIIYGVRRPADLLYPSELERWRQSGVDVEITVDRGDESWEGHTGVVTKLLPRVRFAPERTLALLCGPEVMMRFATRDLVRLGVPEREVFVSLERSMKCAVGTCGHCMLASEFLCKDGPVFSHGRVAPLLAVPEL